MSKTTYLVGSLITLCAAAGVPSWASAQETTANASASNGLEEVVVTARKRVENVLDVPISVQTFSAQDLAQEGITDLYSLKDAAGFTFQQTASTIAGGRNQASIIFRGMQSTYGDPSQNSGSLFVDGIFIAGGQASVSTVDVDRVEVLKGPQNTYFGRNTFGGAINFITKAPSDDFKTELTASGTDRGSSDDVLTLQGPIVKGLLDGRITLSHHTKAAEYRASDGGDMGGEETEGVDGSLAFTPDNGLHLRLNGHYQEDDDSSAALGYLSGQAPYGNTCAGRTFNVQNSAGVDMQLPLSQEYFCGSIPTISQLSAQGYRVVDANTAVPASDLPPILNNSLHNVFMGDVPRLDHTGMRRNIFRISVLGDYSLPYGATAAVNMGYNSAVTNVLWDVDRTSYQSFLWSLPQVSHDFTVDARVSSDPTQPLRGLVGVSYFTQLYQLEQNSYFGPGLSNTPAGFLVGLQSLGSYENERSFVPAVYASLDYDVLSNLTASAEVRYQSDKNEDNLTIEPGYVAGVGAPRVSETNNTAMPRFIVRYKPVTGMTTYVSYSEGVLPTQLQASYPTLTAAGQTYVCQNYTICSPYSKQSKIEMVEAGIKQSLFDNRFEYAFDVYHGLWEDQQTESVIFGGPFGPGGANFFLSNQATIKGFELTTKALITRGWDASLAVNYVHAIWDSYNNATLANFIQQPAGATGLNQFFYFKGNYVGRVPAWTGSFSTGYTAHFVGDWDWYSRATVTYTGSMWDSDINIVKTDPFARVNAVLGMRKENYSIELFAKNLFNDQHWDLAERVPNLAQPSSLSFANEGLVVSAPDKQEIGLRGTIRF
jgi:iron complex outermembrane receptor protein